MRIIDYLSRQANLLERDSARIRDFRVFDFNYIPDQPVMRDEVRPLVDACLRYLRTGIANNLFVFGGRGSGKTLMVRYVGHLLDTQQNAAVLYVNCRTHNTSFKILANLLGVRPRGFSIDELWHRFSDAHPERLILVLDEVDLISDKDRHKDLLYLLARSPNNYMTILLSNHPKFLTRLDESIRSSLQPEMIHFRNYDANEICEILIDRAKQGLRELPRATLPEIAALTARTTNSDVRVAIKSLYYWALTPKTSVRDLFENARRDVLRDVVTDLSDQSLLILRASLDCPEPFVKRVYEAYCRACSAQHETPFSYVHFYSSLSYLQSIGLILLLSTKVGRTYTNRLQLLVDSELLAATWRVRFC